MDEETEAHLGPMNLEPKCVLLLKLSSFQDVTLFKICFNDDHLLYKILLKDEM